MRIWVHDLATGAARPLPGTEEGYRPFWSPDGRRIGFFTWSHLATTPSEGGAVARLAPARDARGGTWSPNGTILFSPFATGPLLAISERGGATRRGDRARRRRSGPARTASRSSCRTASTSSTSTGPAASAREPAPE